MDALLRPGIRLSMGVVRAANGSGLGINPNLRSGRLVSRTAPSALSGTHMATLRLRMYSTGSKPPPSDPNPSTGTGSGSTPTSSSNLGSTSNLSLENSPFAHLLKKVVPPAPEKPASSNPEADTKQTPASPGPADSVQQQQQQQKQQKQQLPSFNKEDLHRNLQDTRKILAERFSVFMDNVQSRVVHASATLNTLTGYTPIEAIKHSNTQLETALAEAQSRVRSARTHYKTMHTRRAATQNEVNTLLSRKDVWTPADLERFTTLYRADHEMESQVARASENLVEAEADEQTLSAKLNQGILRRYHEEQVWSDRIRRASTWGTWGLMGVNILLFLVLQFFAEPWKRNRLVKGVVAEEKAVLEEVRNRLDYVMQSMEENLAKAQALAHQAPPAAVPAPVVVATAEPTTATVAVEEEKEVVPEPTPELIAETPLPTPSRAAHANSPLYYLPLPAAALSWKELVSTPKLWRDVADDLCSEREVELRMRDATALVLEGMAFGTMVTAAVAAIVMGSR